MWHAIARGGAQHRFIRMQLQVLSLATTQPEIYGSFAVTAVHVMIQPIAAAFERAASPRTRPRPGPPSWSRVCAVCARTFSSPTTASASMRLRKG
jgi:hypothetical protein